MQSLSGVFYADHNNIDQNFAAQIPQIKENLAQMTEVMREFYDFYRYDEKDSIFAVYTEVTVAL